MLRLFLILWLSALSGVPQSSTARERSAGLASVPGTPFERREVADLLGRKVTYYISQPKGGLAPILLMLQGSGCARVINEQRGSSFSTVFNLVPFAQDGQFTVVAVEKPYAGMGSPGGSAGTARQCSTEFNQTSRRNAGWWPFAPRSRTPEKHRGSMRAERWPSASRRVR